MKPEPSPGLVLAVLLPIQLGKEGAVVVFTAKYALPPDCL